MKHILNDATRASNEGDLDRMNRIIAEATAESAKGTLTIFTGFSRNDWPVIMAGVQAMCNHLESRFSKDETELYHFLLSDISITSVDIQEMFRQMSGGG